jgi:hypothetical protein
MMMGANLVGFVVGLDGARHVFGVLLGSAAGLRFMALACGCIWVAAQLMFEYRCVGRRSGRVGVRTLMVRAQGGGAAAGDISAVLARGVYRERQLHLMAHCALIGCMRHQQEPFV